MIRANLNAPLVPLFGVQLNGTPLGDEVAGWIANVIVEDDLDVPGMFTLELMAREELDGPEPWTDADQFSLGTKINVSFGYDDRLEELIAGEITALEPSFHVGGPPTLLVRGYDRRHRLNAARRTRAFLNLTDSKIAEEICQGQLDVDATDSKVEHQYVLQAGQTDLEFLLERARRIHYELKMESEKLFFRPVANATPPSDQLTFTFASGLLEFNPRLSLVPVTETQVTFWDPKEAHAVSAEARAVDKAGKMGGTDSSAQVAGTLFTDAEQTVETEIDVPVASAPEADQIARARFDAAALDLIRGEGACFGCTGVRAGETIRLNGLGKRFSGNYYVISAVHSYTRRDGYLTRFRVQRNES